MRENWKNYIEEKILESEIKISKPLVDFCRNLEVIEIEYDEFHDETFSESDFGIYYYDLKWNGKLIEARKTDILEDCKVFWGMPSENPEEYFDHWLVETFQIDVDEEIWFLDALDEYFLLNYGE